MATGCLIARRLVAMSFAVAWALSGHPRPYDPEATVAALVAERERLATGSAAELHARAEELGRPWPKGISSPPQFGPGFASLRDLRQARPALRETDNPYGRLSVSRTLRVTAGLADSVAKARID